MATIPKAEVAANRPRKPFWRLAAAVAAVVAAVGAQGATTLPLEFVQSGTTHNYSSRAGVPISGTVGVPPGSDGQLPTSNESGSNLPATRGQFQSAIVFGGTHAPRDHAALAAAASLVSGTATNFPAAEMQLPRGGSGAGMVALRRAQIGAPYLSRQVSFLFGSQIAVPETDEGGLLLRNIVKEQYWIAEPFSTNNHVGARYYWSANAQKVYAIQAGPVTVTWRKAAPLAALPQGANPADYHAEGGLYFRLHNVTYIVSGSPSKPPRKLYWTEKSFQQIGKLVGVPTARVGGVQFVYNANFPRTVAAEYAGPGQSVVGEGTTNSLLPELRTAWYDQQTGQIHAYNQEGRVFVELLGDLKSDNRTRLQLGFEIVDVVRQVNPFDITIELGERVTPPPPFTLQSLSPEPIPSQPGIVYAYQHSGGGGELLELYAIRETRNLNDFLVHWMEQGVAGLKWPSQLARYSFVWPTDISKYSQYIRPAGVTEAQSQETAVPLAMANVPVVAHQDDLERPRAKLTPDSRFYTHLDASFPAHRTLLQFTSGGNVAFERVFSWLDANLKSTNFQGTVAATLSAYNPASGSFSWPSEFSAPRVVHAGAVVGQRLAAPQNEAGSGGGSAYMAGHIRETAGNLYHPGAYIDPFAGGFELANRGAIIPVNAVPGNDKLEVWWFRANRADAAKGFATILWPSVIGTYTIDWPANPPEIVLASNQGSAASGFNDPAVARGRIYVQNQPGERGYNPNEEHALMQAGVVYALRDDLNITNGINFSSRPFVLVDYLGADGRPAMVAYRVLREKPEAGWVFDYVTRAGTLLQPPMPLGLLPPPVAGTGDGAVNYNREPTQVDGDLPPGWNQARDGSGLFGHYNRFTFRDRKNLHWVYRGPHAGSPLLQIGRYNTDSRVFEALPEARAVAGQDFAYHLHASREEEYLSLRIEPDLEWAHVAGLSIQGTPRLRNVGTNTLQLIVRNVHDGVEVTNTLRVAVAAAGAVVAQPPLEIRSTNSQSGTVLAFTNRPPFLAHSPAGSNSFTMRFYYKTLPDFAWPGQAWPPVGSIVPYLRPLNPANGAFVGEAGSSNTASLEIVYRPAWPEADPQDSSKPVPTMPYGQTLTEPVAGLPGVRSFKTASLLYQQSIAAHIDRTNDLAVSAVLHDPTRQKTADFQAYGLSRLPSGIRTDSYQGKTYFPNLPPHLVSRVFYDPNAGPKGSLVLQGEYRKELAGESYLLLNILRDADLDAVRGLCPAADPQYAAWRLVVDRLATRLEHFVENRNVPGTFVPRDRSTNLIVSVDGKVMVLADDMVGADTLAVVAGDNVAVDSYALSSTGPGSGYITLVENNGTAFTEPGDPVALHVIKVGGGLHTGELKVIAAPNPLSEQVTFQHTGDMAGRASGYEYEWRVAAPVDGLPPVGTDVPPFLPLTSPTIVSNLTRYTLGGPGVRSLSDNYLIVRYRPTSPTHPYSMTWSDWTRPQLAEGWIKRALAGINPFNQRVSDFFNNPVVTDASLIQEAGRRWEGDVALNADTLNNFGLIEIYETILRRGRSLSIESGFNYGPANDALLLAAGYLGDLYMLLGNEAAADAANPTIGVGTKDMPYGEISTSLFAFKGQASSLMEEELALLRGRDDFLLPSVQSAPFYNRLVWNYTRGIDSGEVIYALNYNIKDENNDGVVNAADAALAQPQGHGDAYGHFLTAIKGYYSLLLNPNFDWVPRTEAVTVLGQPVSVDYVDERKFAAAAAAVARTGLQVYELSWRKDYQPRHEHGWGHMGQSRAVAGRSYVDAEGATNTVTRHWGMDHVASRAGQGGYIHWVVGNAMLPASDPNPEHEGIQKIDRDTVPELRELPAIAEALQVAVDNAEGGLTPIGLPEGGVAFDINPNQVVGGERGSHYEQVYERAKLALQNAVSAFDDAKGVTSRMRSQQESLDELRQAVLRQEMAYTNSLIEIFGTPYPDDVGPGKTYPQNYAGPDLLHAAYVEDSDLVLTNLAAAGGEFTIRLDTPAILEGQVGEVDVKAHSIPFGSKPHLLRLQEMGVSLPPQLSFTFDGGGNFKKPAAWKGRRLSPGKVQEAIGKILQARNASLEALVRHQMVAGRLDRSFDLLVSKLGVDDYIHSTDVAVAGTVTAIEGVKFLAKSYKLYSELTGTALERALAGAAEAIPKSIIAGLAAGGDTLSGARAILYAQYAVARSSISAGSVALEIAQSGFAVAKESYNRLNNVINVEPLVRDLENARMVEELQNIVDEVQASRFTIDQRLREMDAALRQFHATMAMGDRLLEERKVFRQRSAALVQGYRVRDTAFRLFRNEQLERYKTLFDLAARYAYLAATAYDFETGLLDSAQGRAFMGRIINARALGVVKQGQPQHSGSSTGDPGLSGALAELEADWLAAKTRLGINNPDAYGTTASLRVENYRILPGTNGAPAWGSLLQQSRKSNLLDDQDVRRHCMQIAPADGSPVPGFIFEFSTTISPGFNVFGQPLAAGDHAYTSSSFATKLFAAGVALEGYRGMDDPAANSSGVASAGGVSPGDPPSWFLDPLALAATPHVYLIPVGSDAIRMPSLGDTSAVRFWNVSDVAIPLPFNIGQTVGSTKEFYTSGDSLTEPLFTIRKHQAFRPVSKVALFNTALFSDRGTLMRSQYTNNRLVGRSVWNTKWKLVIPANTLLHNPSQGMERFVHTVSDIKVHFVTYSHSGN